MLRCHTVPHTCSPLFYSVLSPVWNTALPHFLGVVLVYLCTAVVVRVRVHGWVHDGANCLSVRFIIDSTLLTK